MRPALLNSTSRRGAAVAAVTAALALALALTPAARAGAAVLSITATALPEEVALGAPVTVSGRIAGEPASSPAQQLQLEAAPYPYRSYAVIAQTQSATDGSFAFTATTPTENTSLRVSPTGNPGVRSATLRVTVDPRVAIHARSLGPGRERLSIRIEHTPSIHPGATSVFWYLGPLHSKLFKLAATSASRELAPGVSYASVIVNPPARRFSYRVCLNPQWEAAMGPAPTHGSCPAHDFRLSSGS
jgi:hypothetical protein